jgi:hypothetical protein
MTAPLESTLPNHDAVAVPGVGRHVTVERPGMWRGARVYVDNLEAKKGGWGKWLLPADDGREIAVRVREDLTGPVLTVGNAKIPIGPRVPAWLGVLVFLPFGLVAVGGAIGGVIGAVGMIVNRGIGRMPLSNGAKAGAMVGVFLASLCLLLVVATLLHVGIGAAQR